MTSLNRRLRRLTSEEYRRLGEALAGAKADGEIDQVVDGAWLLALSGCRLGEIVNLKWREVDAESGCFRLSDSKEGATARPAGRVLLDYIAMITVRRTPPGCLPLPAVARCLAASPRGGSVPRKALVSKASLLAQCHLRRPTRSLKHPRRRSGAHAVDGSHLP